MRMSLTQPTDLRVKTKERFLLRNPRLYHEVYSYFRPRTEVCLRLGGHKHYFLGAQAPKCSPVVPGLLLYFGAQSLLGGHNSRLWGAQAVICGARPRNAFTPYAWRRACTLHPCKPPCDAIIQKSASKNITL